MGGRKRRAAVAVHMLAAVSTGAALPAAAADCAPGLAQDAFRAHPSGGPALVSRLDTLARSCPSSAGEIAAAAAGAGPAVQAAAGAGLARAAAAFWGTDRGAALAAQVGGLPASVFSGAFFAVLGVLTGRGPGDRPPPQAQNPYFNGGNAPCRPGNSWQDRDRCAASPR